MNKKKSPLVFYYVEKRDGVPMGGKIFYINHKNRHKILQKIKEFCDVLDDRKDFEVDIEKIIAYWIKRFGTTIKDLFIRERLKTKSMPKRTSNYRPLSFIPEYREIKEVDRSDNKVTSLEINLDILPDDNLLKYLYLYNIGRYRIVKRIMNRSTVIEKKIVEDVINCELKTEKTKEGKVILIDFNTTNPFQNIITRDNINRLTQMNTRLRVPLREKINPNHKISSIDLEDLEKVLYFSSVEDLEKIPAFFSYLLDIESSKDSGMISGANHDIPKLKKMHGVRRILTYPYSITYEFSQKRGVSIENINRLFNSFIYGNIDFSDYPNERVTVSHALDIDGDLLSTFNLSLKELDPNSFQCIEVEYSKEGKISRISLDGPITQDFHMTS